MSRREMLCPFSGQLCRECPVYRGRHLNLCYATRDGGGGWGSSQTTGCKLQSRADDFEQWKLLKQLDIPMSPKWLANLEDNVE
jgi:hypothetical protein